MNKKLNTAFKAGYNARIELWCMWPEYDKTFVTSGNYFFLTDLYKEYLNEDFRYYFDAGWTKASKQINTPFSTELRTYH